jgi:deazaflavin-dependent oxidoreductase (nitroreductase family)
VRHTISSVVVALFALVFLHAPWIIRVLNPVFRPFLRSGLPGGPNILLTVRGRKSRLLRSTPVAILELGDRRDVQASYGEVNWVRNLRAAGEAMLTKGRLSEPVQAIELAPETAGPILRDALAAYRRSSLLRTVVGPVERPPVGVLRFFGVRIDETLDEYLAEARRHPLFELSPHAGVAHSDPV